MSATPGPWKVAGGQQSWSGERGTIEYVLGLHGVNGDVAEGEGEVVATLHTGPGKMDNAANRALIKADAALIAAAPPMYEACLAAEQLLASISSLPSDLADFQNTALRALREAIAKARGER